MLLPKPLIYKTPIQYFLVILCGYFIDFSMYAALVSLNVSVYWAFSFGFLIGSLINTIMIRKFISRQNRFSFIADVQLSLTLNSIVFFLGMVVLWILVELILINPYGAKLLTNGLTFLLNYIARDIFFWKK